MIYLAVASNKYNEDNYSFYILTDANYKFLCEKYPQFLETKIADFSEAVLYAVKDFDNVKAKKATIKSIEKINSSIKIIFDSITDTGVTCLQVKKKLYAIKCYNGWKDTKGLYALPLSATQYNGVIFPPSNTVKHASKMSLLEQLKLKSDWKGIADLFEPLKDFETNYFEIWDNAEELDKIVYALAKLTEPSDRLKKKYYYNPFFLKFNVRTTELEPWNLKYQTLLAYHHYAAYIKSKSQKDYDLAKPLYEKIINANPNNVVELYRYAKLNHFFADANHFVPDFDYKIVGLCEKYYRAALAAYDNISSEESKKRERKNVISILYNLIVLYLDYYLDYEKAFFEIKLFKRDKAIATMLNKKKFDLLSECKTFLDRLFELLDLNLQTNNDSLVYAKSTKEDSVNALYRAAQLYQFFAIVYNLTGKELDAKYKEYINESGQYIKKFLEIVNLRKNKGIRGLPSAYIHGVKAMNLYLSGNVKQAVESLKRGGDDSLLKAAQILSLECEKEEALSIIDAIVNKSLMYNRAQYLKDFISNV